MTDMKRKLLIILIWLLIWQGVAWLVHNPVLIAGPWDTLKALVTLAGTAEFYQTVGWSLLRILLGILLGTGAGFILAYLSHRYTLLRDFLSPVVSLGKAIPVASFVILLLIWIGSRWVALPVVILITFPVAYLNLLKGLDTLDVQLSEMAELYRISFGKRLRFVEIPQLRGHIAAALSLASGMGFKSGVAAEVIGQSRLTIGNSMYRSKIYLEIPELFAWTAVVIFLSWGTEKLLQLLLKRLKVLKKLS